MKFYHFQSDKNSFSNNNAERKVQSNRFSISLNRDFTSPNFLSASVTALKNKFLIKSCFHCLLCESVALSHETTTKEEEVMNRLKLKFLVTGTLNMINTLIEMVFDFFLGIPAQTCQ